MARGKGFVHIEFDGLESLKKALRDLPLSLKREAYTIVKGHATAAFHDIQDNYPVSKRAEKSKGRPGDLKRGMRIESTDPNQFAVSFMVKNVAPHSWIFENGTGPRQQAGGRRTGSMKPGRVFVPRAIKYRLLMYRDLVEMLRNAGGDDFGFDVRDGGPGDYGGLD